ncbi:MAG TPA: efflux RND transporter periplasmic adaptor subunit [Clostridia bacterium]|nr:efflux RND transporter periplasmic adaptor subunit [Clostridia bacterium]
MKNRKKLIIIAAIVLVVIIIAAVRIITSTQGKVKEVDISTAETKNLSQKISVTGNIEAAGKEEISLSTQQKVLEVYVQEGQEVKAGTSLLKTDSSDYEYQLRKYELALELANMNLQRLLDTNSANDKKSLENAVRTAEISLHNTETAYNEAKRRYDQNSVLYESGAVSREEYETALKSMTDAKNAMELATMELDNAKDSLEDFGVNNSDQIKEKRNQVESAKADIANIKENIGKSIVKSSISGKLVRFDAKPNQYPTVENSTITIYDLSEYKVKIPVSQYDAVSISKGQEAAVKVKGIDTEYSGTVTAISDAAVISQDGTDKEPKVEIEVTLDNPDDKIKAGYEADIDITLHEIQDAVAVGFEAVQEDEDGNKYVFAVENDKAVKRIVRTGLETDFEIQLLDGLKAGDSYIKSPPATLKDGDPVKQSGGNNSDNKS